MQENKPKSFVKQCISTALLQLLDQQPYQTITITQICRRAGVSRMAYYANYKSKEDIVRQIVQDVFGKFEAVAQKDSLSDRAFFTVALQFFLEFRTPFLQIYDAGLFHLLMEYFRDNITQHYPGLGMDAVTQKYLPSYLTGIFLNVCLCWLRDAAPEPPEVMAGMIANLLNVPI